MDTTSDFTISSTLMPPKSAVNIARQSSNRAQPKRNVIDHQQRHASSKMPKNNNSESTIRERDDEEITMSDPPADNGETSGYGDNEGNRSGDDDMDEVLADLRPLGKRFRANEHSTMIGANSEGQNGEPNSNPESMSVSGSITGSSLNLISDPDGPGPNSHIDRIHRFRERCANRMAITRYRRGLSRFRSSANYANRFDAAFSSPQRIRRGTTRVSTAAYDFSRVHDYFRQSPEQRQNFGHGDDIESGVLVNTSPIVITLSDDSDNESEHGNGDVFSSEVLTSYSNDATGSSAVTVVEDASPQMNSAVVPPIEGDEAFARRLQRQLNTEYREELRQQRLIRFRDLLREQERAMRQNSPVVESTDTSLPSSVIGQERDVVGSDNGPRVEPVPPRNPPVAAFHRRPYLELYRGTRNANSGHRIITRSVRAQNIANAAAANRNRNSLGDGSGSDTSSANRGQDLSEEREISTLVDLMRMRRVWFQRAIRYGDFGPLDAALMDLAQTFGGSLSDEEISRLPTSVFSSFNASTSSSSNSTCTICMDDFIDEDVQRHLPCLHTFHKNCVDTWLKQKCTCPICRFDARGSNVSTSV